jgi:hypothetical protein
MIVNNDSLLINPYTARLSGESGIIMQQSRNAAILRKAAIFQKSGKM